MRKELLGIALAPLLWASEAPAMPITAGSTLSLNGADMYTPTSIAFTGPANIGGQTGSFTALSNCTGCAAMSDFDATTPTPFPVYTLALLGTALLGLWFLGRRRRRDA